jgi:hypothetical protein
MMRERKIHTRLCSAQLPEAVCCCKTHTTAETGEEHMASVSVRLPVRDRPQGGCIDVEVAEQESLRTTSPDAGFQYGRLFMCDRLTNRHCGSRMFDRSSDRFALPKTLAIHLKVTYRFVIIVHGRHMHFGPLGRCTRRARKSGGRRHVITSEQRAATLLLLGHSQKMSIPIALQPSSLACFTRVIQLVNS